MKIKLAWINYSYHLMSIYSFNPPLATAEKKTKKSFSILKKFPYFFLWFKYAFQWGCGVSS